MQGRDSTAPGAGAEFLAGLVDRVTYHDAESGFCVLRVDVHGRRDPVTVVGHAAQVTPGEHLQATGAWVNDRTHGLQFKADWLRVSAPNSLEGIERYLGVRPDQGHRQALRAAAGAAVRRSTCSTSSTREPDRLRDVPGIGPMRARRMVENWQAQRAIRDIMVFLHGHGVSTARAVRIYKTYGTDAVKVLTRESVPSGAATSAASASSPPTTSRDSSASPTTR